MAATVVVQVYSRFFSDRAPRWQLWLSPAGVAQLASTPEARFAQQAQRWLWALFIPIVICAGPLRRMAMQGSGPALIIAAFVFLALVIQLAGFPRRRARDDADAHGSSLAFTPNLWPWSSIDTGDVYALTGDRARVKIMATRRWGRIKIAQQPIVDIELELTPAQADELRVRLVMWMPLTLG